MHSLGVDKNDNFYPAFSLKSDKIKSGLVGFFFLFWTGTENWFLAKLYIPYTTVYLKFSLELDFPTDQTRTRIWNVLHPKFKILHP